LNNINLTWSPGNIITDLGCGPFTFTSALWIARPDLRNVPLEFNCIDRNASVLEAGKKYFNALTENTNTPWKINIIREDIDIRQIKKEGKIKKASLVCAVNLFNEIYENISHNNTAGLKHTAANAMRLMSSLTSENGSILTVEPGVPQSGKFISFLRDAFIEQGRLPVSPCTHAGSCPANTREKRWCHFAYETTCAPKELRRLSAAARIPKERLTLSYLLAGTLTAQATQPAHVMQTTIRIISDAFPLPDNCFGRYGCCEHGLVLLTADKKRMEKLISGSLFTSNFNDNIKNKLCDEKSGAIIVEVQ
jgi:hypothetical protein